MVNSSGSLCKSDRDPVLPWPLARGTGGGAQERDRGGTGAQGRDRGRDRGGTGKGGREGEKFSGAMYLSPVSRGGAGL